MFQWTTLHSGSHASTESVDFTIDTVRQRMKLMKYSFKPQQLYSTSTSHLCIHRFRLWNSFHSYRCMHNVDIPSLSTPFRSVLNHFILMRQTCNLKRHSTGEREKQTKERVKCKSIENLGVIRTPVTSSANYGKLTHFRVWITFSVFLWKKWNLIEFWFKK